MESNKITRRGLIKSGVATSAALAAPTIWIPASAASPSVNVWTYANFIPKDFKKEFEKETGIRIRTRLVDDQGKEFNLLAAEKTILLQIFVPLQGIVSASSLILN